MKEYQGLRPSYLDGRRLSLKPILAAHGITKRFPGVLALDGVDLEVLPGEVHAVLGQNGAGKTTLMKILFGLVQPDAGTVGVQGRPVRFRSPHDALAHGIGMVHQTRRLVAAHTALENIVLGHPRVRGLLNLRAAGAEVEALCARYGFPLDLGARVWQLSEGERQWVEILKALYRGARILILDEPTSVLTPPEVHTLLAGLQALVRDDGVTVLLVTHNGWPPACAPPTPRRSGWSGRWSDAMSRSPRGRTPPRRGRRCCTWRIWPPRTTRGSPRSGASPSRCARVKCSGSPE
jgi:ABC-type branched-subunit amino acid transport system ATPase component